MVGPALDQRFYIFKGGKAACHTAIGLHSPKVTAIHPRQGRTVDSNRLSVLSCVFTASGQGVRQLAQYGAEKLIACGQGNARQLPSIPLLLWMATSSLAVGVGSRRFMAQIRRLGYAPAMRFMSTS